MSCSVTVGRRADVCILGREGSGSPLDRSGWPGADSCGLLRLSSAALVAGRRAVARPMSALAATADGTDEPTILNGRELSKSIRGEIRKAVGTTAGYQPIEWAVNSAGSRGCGGGSRPRP